MKKQEYRPKQLAIQQAISGNGHTSITEALSPDNKSFRNTENMTEEYLNQFLNALLKLN